MGIHSILDDVQGVEQSVKGAEGCHEGHEVASVSVGEDDAGPED